MLVGAILKVALGVLFIVLLPLVFFIYSLPKAAGDTRSDEGHYNAVI